MSPPLLSPTFLRQLEQLELSATRRSRSTLRGERRSRARGQSVEFADHRNYVPGDDLRYLDWNLYGRLDRLFVKLYEEERELPVRLLLDGSESMLFGSPSKFDEARKLAAALGYVAISGFDRVSVHLFPDDQGGDPGQGVHRRALRDVRGKRVARSFLDHLGALEPGGNAELNTSLRRIALDLRSGGGAIVLSDFLDEKGYAAGLEALAARGVHVEVVQILSAEEWQPASTGDLRLVDAETGTEREVTFGKFRLAAYQKTVNGYVQALRSFCVSRGMGFHGWPPGAAVEDVVLRHLREAGVFR